MTTHHMFQTLFLVDPAPIAPIAPTRAAPAVTIITSMDAPAVPITDATRNIPITEGVDAAHN